MSVVELSALQSRYARASDRFKAVWTFHQFATGVFGKILHQALPYQVDFTRLYDRVKHVSSMLNVAQASQATLGMDDIEHGIDRASRELMLADDKISPSVVRRFFEKLKRQDDNIIHFLIKFYFYADAVEGDRRDKIDFLFTRLGEDWVPQRAEYVSRESLDLRQRVIALVTLLRLGDAPSEEIVSIIRAIRRMREDIAALDEFDSLIDSNLLKNARTFKHRIGDLYFNPDVLMAVIDLNVTTKNRFAKLYPNEEQRLLADAENLMEHGKAIEQNFGDSNPSLLEEIARFRDYKERFDALRAQSNVKHDVVAGLKASMNNILAQLDRGLQGYEEVPAEFPAELFDETRRVDSVTRRFGSGEPLLEYVLRIDAAIEILDPSIPIEELVELPSVRELRLETWEAAAYQKLIEQRAADGDDDTEELWLLYVRAAALRIKVDEEATILATAMAAGVRPEPELLTKAKHSLDLAKELDELFGDFLQEAVYFTNRKILHQLYRSRFRLLRGFSGLWLIYDRQS
ncbi:MAG TPA: hypothetical protein VJZ00_05810 [Thermoanaerobaculia bacterium]|nr:hypothetical protein [Thermoanaerobaculia bacterium]